MKIAIIGAAELGKLVAIHAVKDSGYEVLGYYDDFNQDSAFNELPILGKIDQVLVDYHKKKFDAIFIAIGYNHFSVRANVFGHFKNKIPFANIIHSSAYVDSSCCLGEGVFILPRVVLDIGVTVGDNVLINTGSIIAHHSCIGAHSFIAPGVHIAGLVNVEEKCFIGIGAIVKDCINIKKSSVVGAGSLVLKDTEENSVSVGVPAKIIKYNSDI